MIQHSAAADLGDLHACNVGNLAYKAMLAHVEYSNSTASCHYIISSSCTYTHAQENIFLFGNNDSKFVLPLWPSPLWSCSGGCWLVPRLSGRPSPGQSATSHTHTCKYVKCTSMRRRCRSSASVSAIAMTCRIVDPSHRCCRTIMCHSLSFVGSFGPRSNKG